MKSTEFIDHRTGELVTSIPLTQISHFSERKIYGGYDDEPHAASLGDYFKKSDYGRAVLDQFIEITEETYDYFLGVLPPMDWTSQHFLMSEAQTATAEGVFRSEFMRRANNRHLHRFVCIPHAANAALERAHY